MHQNKIGKEISNLFYKYANENNLSFSDAKKYLNSSEFREFKKDLKSYMKLIEETGDEELLLELNTLAMKSRISRLEEMFYQCGKYISSNRLIRLFIAKVFNSSKSSSSPVSSISFI